MIEVIRYDAHGNVTSLADNSAQALDSLYANVLERSFAMTKVSASLQCFGVVQGTAMLAGIAMYLLDTTMTVTDLGTFVNTRQDPEDAVLRAQRQQIKAVAKPIQGSYYREFDSDTIFTSHMLFQLDEEFGRRGVPFEEGKGWNFALLNRAGAAISLSYLLNAKVTGYWLE